IDIDRETPSWMVIYVALLLPVLKLPFGWLALVAEAWLRSTGAFYVVVSIILFLNSLTAICLGWLVYDWALHIRRSHAWKKPAAYPRGPPGASEATYAVVSFVLSARWPRTLGRVKST